MSNDALDNNSDNTQESVTFSGDQKIKLTQLLNEGGKVLHEIDTLNEGLNETIKALAEELNIKSSVLKKAVKIAHKAEFHKTQREQELLENILITAGKTL